MKYYLADKSNGIFASYNSKEEAEKALQDIVERYIDKGDEESEESESEESILDFHEILSENEVLEKNYSKNGY